MTKINHYSSRAPRRFMLHGKGDWGCLAIFKYRCFQLRGLQGLQFLFADDVSPFQIQ